MATRTRPATAKRPAVSQAALDENGQVLAILSTGPQMKDKTDKSRDTIKLPDERNGIAMVFRPFERVSYVLVMEITNPVQVGDKLINPN